MTIHCFPNDNFSILFYWYKQSLGEEPRIISSFYAQSKTGTFQEHFEREGRFTLDNELNKHHLIINNLKISDLATYYCCSANVYIFTFGQGTFVSVQDPETNIQASIHQLPVLAVSSGEDVTLNCTVHTGNCSGNHSVYWFRSTGKTHPGLIYTERGSDDQCGRNNYTTTCEYNLSMASLNDSNSGTYYCAVASCGLVLFGNGTRVDLKGEYVDSIRKLV